MPSSAQPDVINNCPDCVFMKLSINPIPSRRSFRLRPLPKKLQLNLTLNFHEHCEMLPAGWIKFGIRSGKLRVMLNNGKIYDPDREFTNNTLCLSISKQQQKAVLEARARNGKTLGLRNGKVREEIDLNSETRKPAGNQFKYSLVETTSKGSEDNILWTFEEQTGEDFLRGQIPDQKLAIITVTRKPCLIKATFQVTERDLYISDTDGVWLSNLSPNKMAIIKKQAIRYLLKTKTNPYLSRQNLRYE